MVYDRFPHFRDIYVEGREDAALINWYLAEKGLPGRAYAIDDRVEIPRDLVTPLHPEVNARGRVVALADTLDSWSLVQPSVTCVVDSDFDLLDSSAPESDSLLKTEYAAMEVYSLAERPLRKFLVTVAKNHTEPAEIVGLLKPAWAIVYALRYVLHRHEDGARMVENFSECCINRRGAIAADASELLRRTKPTPTRSRIAELLDMHADYLALIPGGGLQGIRGHDVAPLLIRYLELRNDLAKPSVVELLMRSSLDTADLDATALFPRIANRVSAS